MTILPLCSLTACSVLGPNFESLQPKAIPAQWQSVDQQDQTDIALWWRQFNDPTLDHLVEMAAEQNLDLEAAGLRIIQARAALGISQGLQYPQVQQVSGNLAKAYQNEKSFDNAALSFDAGWELDVWGKYARGIESAEALMYASIASYRDIAVTITAEVARNYINYRTFQERILLSKRNIEIQQRVVHITQVQYDSGNVTELDVQQAKNQLYTTKAALPSLKIAMLQARNALAVLLCVLPSEVDALLGSDAIDKKIAVYDSRYAVGKKAALNGTDKYSLVPHIPKVDNQIDANLVMRRPDLQVAELQAHSQSAKIGLAETALYPSFSLLGSIGINSTVPSDRSFSFSDSLMLVAGPSFSWNIFQYGRVKNNIRLEDARFQESLTNYNKKVLVAVQEVTNALESYDLYTEQKALRLQSVNSSIRAFNISMTQYENGQISFERLLNSVEKMTRSEDSYAQIKGNVANQVVALYKALGGGWQITSGKPLVADSTIETMKSRTDWGTSLDEDLVMPKADLPKQVTLPQLDPEKVPVEELN
ncbi:TPA: TolC family protein [Photobacterium damselae]